MAYDMNDGLAEAMEAASARDALRALSARVSALELSVSAPHLMAADVNDRLRSVADLDLLKEMYRRRLLRPAIVTIVTTEEENKQPASWRLAQMAAIRNRQVQEIAQFLVEEGAVTFTTESFPECGQGAERHKAFVTALVEPKKATSAEAA